MTDAADYLAHVKTLIIMHPQVAHWRVMREEAQGDAGLFRYRLILKDGEVLELFERFLIQVDSVVGLHLNWVSENNSV